MAKMPKAGQVKTRLARSIGVSEAVRTYRTLLRDTLQTLSRDPRWHTWIAVSPDNSICDPVWPTSTSLVGQGRGSLGDRMQKVFDVLPIGPIVIIGSDVPEITRHDIAAAFKTLGHCDAVIGPSPDGGYWLIGAKRRPHVPRFFSRVRWSSPHTASDTIANLAAYKVGRLREVADLDEIGDYRRWKSKAR